MTSTKATIITKEGVKTEVEPIIIHDFIVVVESHGKTHKLEKVITDAKAYTEAISQEISETEKKFLKQ